MTYLERQEVKQMIESSQKARRKMTRVELALWVSALPTIALVVSLVAWSTTWGWAWYGYTAFYSIIVLLWPCVALYLSIWDEIE